MPRRIARPLQVAYSCLVSFPGMTTRSSLSPFSLKIIFFHTEFVKLHHNITNYTTNTCNIGNVVPKYFVFDVHNVHFII